MKQTRTRVWSVMAGVGLMLAAHSAQAGMEGWLDDFEKAKADAQKAGRPILVNFSGSDWCGWCIRLDKEVLQKPQFNAYAKDSLVLFNADFPRQTKLSEKLTKQNEALVQRYSVEGFPTVLLVDAAGDLIGRTGYQPGGPEAYVSHLRELLSKRQAPATAAPKPNEYDAENDRYWNADHGHWHPGRPPSGN
jgi:thioredoxin-related protein